MNEALVMLGYNNITQYKQNIINTLSSYIEKFINNDGSIRYSKIETTYFIVNDTWNIDFFGNIEQFKSEHKKYNRSGKKIFFRFNNFNINTEVKFITYHKLFKNLWSLDVTFVNQNNLFKRLSEFINQKYPNITSILDLNIDKANIEWIDWLENKKNKITRNFNSRSNDKQYTKKTPIANILKHIYQELFNLTDMRNEWDKDIWDARNLQKYGVEYNKTSTNYKIDFTLIDNLNMRKGIKKYFKQRLIGNNNFTIGQAKFVLTFLPKFINFICKLEPNWNDFKMLERNHIEKYIEWLNIYVKNNLKDNNGKISNPSKYKIEALNSINKFLVDIQIKNYNIAPINNISRLIFREDRPTKSKKAYDQIDYVPDFVLEQLLQHINNLNKTTTPVVWTMYKTGLRISDSLSLKCNCLVKLNNKFWIETDIKKTYVKGHRIPIDDELANMLAVLINQTRQNSNQDNNPEDYIFVRYTGSRKGKPYTKELIQSNLNTLASKYNIVDEMGNRYHFRNHAFRHTYAVKMLNGGADILTVQELLAHASPEMTLRYAKLLDDTKRKVFDNAIKQGVFSFNIEGKLYEEINVEIPNDILDMLWTNHKLNAIDTPYGTCLQRANGKCSFAKQPPCLTCSGGNPCKDLCIGAFEGDIQKYKILINSTKSMIESAKTYNRIEMAKENEELLKLYEDVHSKIIEGNIIYSRLDRLKKIGEHNE